MLLPNLNEIQTQEVIEKAEQIIFLWESDAPGQRKYSKKTGFSDGFPISKPVEIPFSILKDSSGNYYFIDNDSKVTHSAEAKGNQGKYRRLFPLKRNTSGHFTLADNIIGVKIENACAKKKPEQQPRQLSLFDDIFSFSGQAGPRPSGPQHRDVVTDIFGEEKAEYVADEVGSLKRCGMYVDHFLVKNKKYILLKHVEGMQLLKFVNTNFSGMPVSQQVETFSRIIQSCMRALMAIHERKIAHNDAQLKNFIIAVETYECTVIDFGSAFLDAKPFQMENDFLTLAREFDYFDRYFDQSEIQYAWLRCKSIFKEQSMCNSVDIDGLIRVIDVFTQQVMKMKTGTSQFVLSSPTSSSCSSSSSTSNLEIGQTDLGQPGYTV